MKIQTFNSKSSREPLSLRSKAENLASTSALSLSVSAALKEKGRERERERERERGGSIRVENNIY